MDKDKKLEFTRLVQSGLNMNAICQQLDIASSTGYQWKKQLRLNHERFISGDKTRKPYSHTATPRLQWSNHLIKQASLKNPYWGCDKLAKYLNDFGIRVTAPTIQTILNEMQIGKSNDRLNSLIKLQKAGHTLSADQIDAAAKHERSSVQKPQIISRGTLPGTRLIQEIATITQSNTGYERDLHIILDTHSNRIFAMVDSAVTAANELLNHAIAFYEQLGLTVSEVWTLPSFLNDENGSFKRYSDALNSKCIQHCVTTNNVRPLSIDKAIQSITKVLVESEEREGVEPDANLAMQELNLSRWLTIHNAKANIYDSVAKRVRK